MAGYSKRSLVDKLGIRTGMTALIENPPEGYDSTLGALPEGVHMAQQPVADLDFIQVFCPGRSELEEALPRLKGLLKPDGMLWVSWPKKASGVASDLNENTVRAFGLAHGLVDVKVAAIDDVWSGLKFVYRLEDR